MARNETTATSTVLLNGEQAKNQLEVLEAKAKALRKSIKENFAFFENNCIFIL